MEWEEINIEKMDRCPNCGSSWLDEDGILNCSNENGKSCNVFLILYDGKISSVCRFIDNNNYYIEWDLLYKKTKICADQDSEFSCVLPFDITLEKLEKYILFS